MTGYTFSENLTLTNFTQLDIDNFSELCKIQSFKEDFLKELDNIFLNFDVQVNMGMNKNGVISFDSETDNSVILNKEDDLDFSQYPDGSNTLIFSGQKPKENLKEHNDYSFRIYESALFLHSDFVYKKYIDKDGKEKSLFEKYERFLFDYVGKTGNPIIVYHITPVENDIMTKFENFSIEGKTYNTNHRFSNENLNKVLYLCDEEKKKELEKIRPGELEIPSIREQLLINFWHSFLYKNQWEKFDDVKMILFMFLEKLEPIQIDI